MDYLRLPVYSSYLCIEQNVIFHVMNYAGNLESNAVGALAQFRVMIYSVENN